MKTNDIDEKFKTNIINFENSVKPKNWDKSENWKKLNGKINRNKTYYKYAVAAIFAGLFVLLTFIFKNEQQTENQISDTSIERLKQIELALGSKEDSFCPIYDTMELKPTNKESAKWWCFWC